jgi:hypothetical protein
LNNKTTTNQQKISNIFNSYFISVADSVKDDKSNNATSNMVDPIIYLFRYYNKPFSKMNWQYTSTYEIEKVIKSLKLKSTCGYDEISNCIIKLSSPYIISPLTYICNAALSTGVFPDRLKYAIVKPVYKKRQ